MIKKTMSMAFKDSGQLERQLYAAFMCCKEYARGRVHVAFHAGARATGDEALDVIYREQIRETKEMEDALYDMYVKVKKYETWEGEGIWGNEIEPQKKRLE